MNKQQIKANLKGKHFLSINDFSKEEILYLLDLADELKEKQKNGIKHDLLEGKTLGMIFMKNSTRTRVSFEVGMSQLGGKPLFLSGSDLQLGRGEPIKDTARVLSRYLDGIMIRTFKHSDVEELANWGSIPIINGLTDLLHPCQAMADLQTIREHKGKLEGLKITYIGDGNNMAHSLIYGAVKCGMHIVCACPKGYEPDKEIVKIAKKEALLSGSTVEVTDDVEKAVKNADILYSDVWTSMGQEKEFNKRLQVFSKYQVNKKLMEIAKEDAKWMHCLPAHRGEEVTEEIMEGSQSIIFDEAENRLHAQKAILASLL